MPAQASRADVKSDANSLFIFFLPDDGLVVWPVVPTFAAGLFFLAKNRNPYLPGQTV
jgi:hypothetical protein